MPATSETMGWMTTILMAVLRLARWWTWRRIPGLSQGRALTVLHGRRLRAIRPRDRRRLATQLSEIKDGGGAHG